MSQQAFGKQYGGSAPECYEKYFVPAIGEPLARDLVEAAALRPGERVLDVACGTGVVARLAAERVGASGSVAGLDVNPGMLAVARSATPSGVAIDWYETSAEATPLPNGAFDVVLCQMGLQFVPRKLAAMKEMRRVLAAGGRTVVNVPGPTPPMFAALADGMRQHVGEQAAGFVHAVFSLHDPGELRELAADAGFRDIAVERTTKTLPLPAPEDFLWQYVHGTPLAGALGDLPDDTRGALQREVCGRWTDFVVDGGLRLEVGMTTLTAVA